MRRRTVNYDIAFSTATNVIGGAEKFARLGEPCSLSPLRKINCSNSPLTQFENRKAPVNQTKKKTFALYTLARIERKEKTSTPNATKKQRRLPDG